MFEIEFRVDFVDTDAMGVVHHSRYFRYLERARVEFLRSLGVSYKKIDEEGYCLPLTKSSMEYLSPLTFDEQARVKVKVAKVGVCTLGLNYEIVSEKRKVLKAHTEHVYCKYVSDEKLHKCTIKPKRWDEEWRSLWQKQKE